MFSVFLYSLDKNFEYTIAYTIRTILSSLLIVLPIIAFISFFFYLFARQKYNLFILSLYKNISTYNSNPVKVIYWIFGNIFVFAIIFWFIFWGVHFWDSVDYSFKNSLQIFGDSNFGEVVNKFLDKKPENIKKFLSFLFIFYSYFQKLFSLLLVLLFGLSLRRKFKR